MSPNLIEKWRKSVFTQHDERDRSEASSTFYAQVRRAMTVPANRYPRCRHLAVPRAFADSGGRVRCPDDGRVWLPDS